jgi:hypothetical protein
VADLRAGSAAVVGFAERHRLAALLVTALLCYAPLIGFGYGGSFDSWRIAETGRSFMATGVYTPSRYPGFPVHEIPAAFLAHFGGPTLSNAGSVAMALLGAYAFFRVIEHFALPHRTLLVLALIMNPVYWTAATYTIDYAWSLALLLAGFALVCHQRYLGGGLVLGLATGSRVSSFAFGVVVLAYQWMRARSDGPRIARSGALLATIAVLSYASIVQRYGLLRLYFGDWNSLDYAANFVYGNLMLLGPQAMIFSAILIPTLALKRGGSINPEWRRLAWFCVVVVAGYETLFAWSPIQVAYLLPTLPCILMLLGIALRHRRGLLVLWLLLSASSAFLSVNVVSVSGGAHYVESALPPLLELHGPGVQGRTSHVSTGIFIRWGYLVSDLAGRREANLRQSVVP